MGKFTVLFICWTIFSDPEVEIETKEQLSGHYFILFRPDPLIRKKSDLRSLVDSCEPLQGFMTILFL